MLTTTEAAILGLLALGGERSGYDLHRGAQASVGYMWAPAKSRIYKVLPTLVERGLAVRREVEQQSRPDKHLYAITPDGERMLREWLEDEPTAEAERNPFLLKVFFGELFDQERLLAQIRERRMEAVELRTRLDEIDKHGRNLAHDFYPRLTRRYGTAWAEAVIRWADEAERELNASSDRVSRETDPA